MRNVLFFSLFLILGNIGKTQITIPCGGDTLEDFVLHNFSMDTTAVNCFPYRCSNIEKCHYFEFPDSFKGGLFVYNDAGDFEIIIVDSCRWVMLDTCANVGAFPSGFQVHYNFPPHTTMAICGQAGKIVSADIKPDPTGLLPNFGAPIYDIETLCGALAATHDPIKPIPMQRKTYFTFDGYYWRQVADRPKEGFWKEW